MRCTTRTGRTPAGGAPAGVLVFKNKLVAGEERPRWPPLLDRL